MKNKILIHSIGLTLWLALFSIGRLNNDNLDSAFIASIVLSAIYGFWFLIRFGLMDKTIVSLRNTFKSSEFNNKKRKKQGLEPIEKINKNEIRKKLIESDWIFPLIFMVSYLITAIIIAVI